MDIGQQLRNARERQGIPLGRIADATKLSTSVLERIERSEFSRLPGGIFTKSYLRAYASEVGLDPELVVEGYIGQHPAASADLPITRAPVAADDAWSIRLTTLSVLLLALFAYLMFGDSGAAPELAAPAVVPGAVVPGETVERPSWPLEVVAAQPEQYALRLEIRPTGDCWVAVVADGRRVIYRVLRRGEHVTIEANERLAVRVGAPETFVYTLNGQRGRPLGTPGMPVSATITGSNYRMFQAGAHSEA